MKNKPWFSFALQVLSAIVAALMTAVGVQAAVL